MCIQESMRLYPAVPNISRCLEKDITLPDGRVVQKGMFDFVLVKSTISLKKSELIWLVETQLHVFLFMPYL